MQTVVLLSLIIVQTSAIAIPRPMATSSGWRGVYYEAAVLNYPVFVCDYIHGCLVIVFCSVRVDNMAIYAIRSAASQMQEWLLCTAYICKGKNHPKVTAKIKGWMRCQFCFVLRTTQIRKKSSYSDHTFACRIHFSRHFF